MIFKGYFQKLLSSLLGHCVPQLANRTSLLSHPLALKPAIKHISTFVLVACHNIMNPIPQVGRCAGCADVTRARGS